MVSAEQRFFTRVDKNGPNGCWLWTGGLNRTGYGKFSYPRGQYAHRFSYELYRGPIPDGLQIDHLCRVHNCVNADHLEVVTQKVNIQRGTASLYQLNKTHCPKGHPYSEENTLRKFSNPARFPRGRRYCRTCNQTQWHAWNEKRKLVEAQDA